MQEELFLKCPLRRIHCRFSGAQGKIRQHRPADQGMGLLVRESQRHLPSFLVVVCDRPSFRHILPHRDIRAPVLTRMVLDCCLPSEYSTHFMIPCDSFPGLSVRKNRHRP